MKRSWNSKVLGRRIATRCSSREISYGVLVADETAVRSRDEAEKPFWISYADLMTALMVLFLVVMSVALLAVTKRVTEQETKENEHRAAIAECLASLEEAAAKIAGIRVDKERRVVDFQDRARFDKNVYQLRSEQAKLLREFAPEILRVGRTAACTKVLKRVAVEGFADQSGSYLYNLNLSMSVARQCCALCLRPSC